jgi:signal transduction histidine kinase
MYASRIWESDSTDLQQAETASSLLCCANIYLGNAERAEYFFEKYHSIRNKYSDKSLHDSLADMEVKYETEKKELRIALLEREKLLYIWLGIAAAAFLLAFIGILFYRHRLNTQKRRLAEQQVKQLEQEKKLVAANSILDGETAERTRLARDLHDGLGGMLSVIKYNLESMENYSIMDGQDVVRFDKALNMLDKSMVELRLVANNIMPKSLMLYGPRVSLEDFCRAIPIARFQYMGEDTRFDKRFEVMIYRCACELINNALKHAHASEINVQLLIDNGVLVLTVQDNGVGFDPEKAASGAGLENIRTRVSIYNGRVKISSSPGNGTEITIEIESISPNN